MIITVGGIKGGTGKTTVATNFACIAAGQGSKVLLVDADDQKTASDFTSARNQDHPDASSYTCIRLTGKNVRSELMKIERDYDHIIIDTGGRDTTSQRAALSLADILLIPFSPRSFDIWTMDQVAQLVDEMSAANDRLQALAFLNNTDPAGKGTENEDAAEMLKDNKSLNFIEAPLGRRKAYSHAATAGLAVTELLRPARNQQAIDEIMTLFRYCFDVTEISEKRHKEAVS
ncbi:MAG: AAA family ATPase [Bryobacteraceae bacterium]